ncbi:hypothetical protein ACFX11_023401 [Malus domestica]
MDARFAAYLKQSRREFTCHRGGIDFSSGATNVIPPIHIESPDSRDLDPLALLAVPSSTWVARPTPLGN